MKEIMVTQLMYLCEYCNKKFNSALQCKEHEKCEHICPTCDHAYYAYGTEFNCERENQGKPCRFKKKKEEE